jgi:nucleoside-diphosphate-sugar epimerase
MSTGSAAIPLLKAAPEPDQLTDRLTEGPWRGLEICLAPNHISDDASLQRAIDVVRERCPHKIVLAEAPVAWPSGSFVSVDRLDTEARVGIERSARFAAEIGAPVLTIHLFAPRDPAAFRARAELDQGEIERFLTFYAETCLAHGVGPLIENVPPILRMRTGGVYFSPIGGHWRDLVTWRHRLPALGFTIDTSHAALFRAFVAAYPSIFGLASDEELELRRYVEVLGIGAAVAHVSDAHGVLAEGLPYGSGELDLDPVVRRLGRAVTFMVAEINEPDPATSVDMKKAYHEIARVLAAPEDPTPRSRPTPSEKIRNRFAFNWQRVVEQRDPVPSVLELQETFGGRRVLITGGGGSIGRALATLLLGFRPEQITLLDGHEPSLIADRRGRGSDAIERLSYALCDVRDPRRLEAELGRARPDVVFHLAAYKHVDWAEVFPEEFVDTNLHGSWSVLRAAESVGVETVVVASTDKAALAASFYGRTKRFMEQLTAFAARRGGGKRIAVRFVNVLGSAGSASELFLRQARADVPLTITDPEMLRYWVTMAHTTTLAAHAALLAGDGAHLAVPADPVELSVGQLAERIWRVAGRAGAPDMDLVGIRRGETLSETLLGSGERLGSVRHQGVTTIESEIPTAGPAWIAERLSDGSTREQARAVWLEAMQRPGLLVPSDRVVSDS